MSQLLQSLDKEQLEAFRYLNDPVAFTKEVIGLEVKWFHREWLRAFEDNKFSVLLAPRGHGKTSIVGSYITWRIVKDRGIRCAIVTINQDKANEMMTFIKANLASNPKLVHLFGEFKSEAEWSRSQIRVRQQAGSVPVKDPTLKVLGVGGRIVSGHYDLVVLDDITDNDSSRTEFLRRELENWYNGPLIGTFMGHTKVINIGTRWHEDDIHNYLMNKAGYKTLRYKALLKEPDEQGEGAEVLWPEHLPWDSKMRDEVNKKLISQGKPTLGENSLTLKFIREHQGELHFAMQYQNEIVPGGIAKFKPQWIQQSIDKYIKLQGVYPTNLRKFIGVDLGGEDKTSDWGVCCVIGLDTEGDIYVLDVIRTHSTLNRQVEIMKALDDKYHAVRIGMDSAAQQKLIVSEVMKENPYLPIIPIKPSKVNDRETRTDRLSLLFETSRVYLNPRLNHLLDELRMYPRAKHDDCIDALSFALEASQESGIIDWNRVADVVITKKYKFRKV